MLTRIAEPDQLRTAVRFPMRLPIRVKTAEAVVDAMTEDISANGILFTGSHLPAVGERIEFTIKMPAQVMGSAEDVSIHCVGRVVRHTRQDREEQSAAIIDEYYLRV